MQVVWQLTSDEDSPLYQKVKVKDDDKGTWVTNKHLAACLAPHTESGGCLAGKTTAQQSTIIKEYLKAIRATWPAAFSDHRSHMLWRPMGLEIMLGVFDAAKHRCDLNSGKEYTEANFACALEPLVGEQVALPGGGAVALDWRRGEGALGALSNMPGRRLISKQLHDRLVQADA